MKLWVIFMFVHKDTLVMNVLKYRVSKRAEQLVQYCVFCVYWPLSHSASLHHYASCLLSLFVTLLIFQSLITVASFPFFFPAYSLFLFPAPPSFLFLFLLPVFSLCHCEPLMIHLPAFFYLLPSLSLAPILQSVSFSFTLSSFYTLPFLLLSTSSSGPSVHYWDAL